MPDNFYLLHKNFSGIWQKIFWHKKNREAKSFWRGEKLLPKTFCLPEKNSGIWHLATNAPL
jgi:hypothetical protein